MMFVACQTCKSVHPAGPCELWGADPFPHLTRAGLKPLEVVDDQVPTGGLEDLIARTVQGVLEWDDRTSPDDWPEALLITPEELTALLRDFAAELGGAT